MARNTTTTTSEPKAPDFVAWHVTSKGDKSYWHKVGASWKHKDGKGMTLQMEATARWPYRPAPTHRQQQPKGARMSAPL